MRQLASVSLAAALAASAAPALADAPFSNLLELTDDSEGRRPGSPAPQELKPMLPGYFNGLGSYRRTWEAQLDTSFDTNRVFAQRLELSRAFSFHAGAAIVVRVNAAVAAAPGPSNYTLKGPIVAVGLRNQTYQSRYWLEIGLRVVPGWDGPNENAPQAQALALGATFSSGLADDARWLPFSDTGVQMYGAIQNRSSDFGPRGSALHAGALYGGQVSLGSMKVRSWLGPQSGFIGNAYIDVFLGLVRVQGVDLSLRVGVHGEVSLSTIWPADRPFPMLGGWFVGWSPVYWLSSRLFWGVAGSPGYTSTDFHGGLRLELYAP